MDLRDFGDALRRFWWLVVAMILAWNAIGVAFAVLRTPSYRATTTLIVEPSGPASDFNSVEVVRFLLPSIAEQVRTSGFARQVREELPPGIDEDAGSISAAIEPGTGILRITAASPDPDAARTTADTAGQVLIERRLSKRIQMTILSPAGQPALPSNVPLLFSSTALGLIFGIAAAVIAQRLRPRFRSGDDLEARLGVRVLGEIPAAGLLPQSTPELFNGGGNWRLAKAYQRLGVSLETALPSNGASAVAVTSFADGEGKTTVTANLAWAMASLRQTVVGIDGDLRHPALHSHFDLQPTNGTGYPREPAQTENPLLSIVPARRSGRDATDVLNSELPHLLRAFSDRLVLVDTPAISEWAEAAVIASMAQAAILVIDIRSRHPAEAERAMHDLRRLGVDVIGVVVNRARSPR